MMDTAKKSIAKSVRLRPAVSKAIEDYRGDGFNAKLDNLVTDYLEKHDSLVRDWELLNASIADKREELRAITARVKRYREVDQRLVPLVDALVAMLDV